MFDFSLFLLPFFQRALVVGILLGVVMAALGVLVVLRRSSFFADAIGHSALTGIALGILLAVNPFFAALGFVLVVAGTIALVRRHTLLHLDTLLGVFYPAAMALGVILVQLTPGYQADLLAFLFGDILTVGWVDVVVSAGLAVVTGAGLWWVGRRLLLMTLDEALARVAGVRVQLYEFLFLLLLAAVIALAVKYVGVVLVAALLIIPAASAQNIARSMSSLFITSVAVSLLAVVAGMGASAALSIPSGPAIVLVAAGLFAVTFGLALLERRAA